MLAAQLPRRCSAASAAATSAALAHHAVRSPMALGRAPVSSGALHARCSAASAAAAVAALVRNDVSPPMALGRALVSSSDPHACCSAVSAAATSAVWAHHAARSSTALGRAPGGCSGLHACSSAPFPLRRRRWRLSQVTMALGDSSSLRRQQQFARWPAALPSRRRRRWWSWHATPHALGDASPRACRQRRSTCLPLSCFGGGDGSGAVVCRATRSRWRSVTLLLVAAAWAMARHPFDSTTAATTTLTRHPAGTTDVTRQHAWRR